jgi:glycerol-1-phosphate dehydrogenase [NAD(P)+]
MNGYLSATSSLLEDGHKHSFSTKTPDYLYLDINILNYASSCLTSAGIGDTLCRSTVQTDLQLAALFQDVDLAQKLLAEVEVEERNLIASESVNMEALVKALLASGRAMTQAGSSAPASQSEHMIAHALEAMYPERCSDLLHGSVIAVTTLTASRHQEAVLASGTLQLQPLITLDALSDAIGKEAMARLYPDYLNKYHQLETALAGIDWPAQKPAMTGRLSTAELEYHLKRFGCPTTPQELGFSDGEYQAAVSIARATRERITALDFV